MKTGITGGIGSGKSFVCQLLKARGYEVYDCDAAAKRLIRTSPIIYRGLTHLIGPHAFLDDDPTGGHTLNKAAVAQFLLESDRNAKAIDAIVHPAVFSDFEESGIQWMESAILFESGMDRLVDRTVVVTAPIDIRIRRVMERDHIDEAKVRQWMDRQWSQERIKALADYEIVNDGEADLQQQLETVIRQMEDIISE